MSRTDSRVQRFLARRPPWMNALMVFCAFMAAVYVPWDFAAKPVANDAEVWLGLRVHGWAAKATEPLHFAIYAAGTLGFAKMRRWMWPWAALYAGQVAVSVLVWALVYARVERGTAGAFLRAAPGIALFVPLAIALWRSKDRFGAETPDDGPRSLCTDSRPPRTPPASCDNGSASA